MQVEYSFVSSYSCWPNTFIFLLVSISKKIGDNYNMNLSHSPNIKLSIFTTIVTKLLWIFNHCNFSSGGPSGSGKTSLAHKMANIIGCEVVSLENYYMCEKMKVPKYDDFGSIDMSLLSEVHYNFIRNLIVSCGIYFILQCVW